MSGAALGAAWALPFGGMLLSIALMPLLLPGFWHRHHGKVALGWVLAVAVPMGWSLGPGPAGHALLHTVLTEYGPFILLLLALFTVSGGLHLRGNLHGTPGLNTAILALGAGLASVMGTTGASMLLIRPLIRANDHRRRRTHLWVFFIFIVGNAGGVLTPLGDPPLFLGFLQGVSFFWTVDHLLPQALFLVGSLLLLFWLIDAWQVRREGAARPDPTPDTPGMAIEGGVNGLLLAAVVGLVLLSGLWRPGVAVEVAGVVLALQDLARDGGLLAVTAASWVLTPRAVRQANRFSWGPMQEVAKLFMGIFITMLPVLAMLKAGEQGALGAVLRAVTGPDGQPLPAAYFWAAGGLSAFLDNAPTYLVFFNLAGGDAAQLMGPRAATLAAISAGSVFMGACSYIGNAPNFMVKAIVEDSGVRMPGFFGYMAWSGGILLPLFALITLIWMH